MLELQSMLKKKSETKNLEPIYSTKHYRLRVLLKNPVFKVLVRNLLKQYKKFGHPVPKKGFRNQEEYFVWQDRFMRDYNKSISFLDAKERKNIPLPPLMAINYIMKKFGLDTNDIKMNIFFDRCIFLGKKEFFEDFFELTHENGKLCIKLYPHTKKEHLLKFWDLISYEQKRMPGYVGKNKKWETFERDVDIFFEYQKERNRRARQNIGRASKKNMHHALDDVIWGKLHSKYSRIELGDIRKAVSRVAKLKVPLKRIV